MTKKNNELKGLVFDIQRYSLHDGPGIRTTVFFKGCPLRCKWCSNPESFMKAPEVAYNKKDCIACYACVKACKQAAVSATAEGITIDKTKCTQNFDCVEVCPTGALTVFGQWMTVDQIMDVVIKDLAFYKNSGGGLTLSGGEVMLQSEFAAALLNQAKANGIHTAIETSGFAQWTSVEMVLEYTDLVLFDVKLVNREKHLTYTGVDNTLILENLDRMMTMGKQLIARIPLVPTVNMDSTSVNDYIELMLEMNIKEVNLLPFHQLGEGKYDMVGLPYPFKGVKVAKDEAVQAVADQMAEAGFHVKIGG